MSDSSGKLGGPLPPPGAGAQYDADDGFVDDKIGAELKAKEAQKRRAAERTRKPEIEERIRAYRKVEQASTFQRSQQEDDVHRRERRFRESDGQRQEGLQDRRGVPARGTSAESVGQQEALVGDLMHEIHSLLEQIDLLGGLDAMEQAARRVLDKEGRIQRGEGKDQVGRLAGSVAELVSLNKKLRRAEMQVKQNLQQLLTGSTGLALLSDPRMTFRRLLDRIKKWPRRIRPGRKPGTDEEFDDFIAWVFEPPQAPADDDEFAW